MKKVTQQDCLNATLKQVEYLLTDWKGNIKNFETVKEDILQRIKDSNYLYVHKELTA
jgi:hypothetical protein